MSSLRVVSYVHVLVPSFQAYVYIHVGFMLNNVRLRWHPFGNSLLCIPPLPLPLHQQLNADWSKIYLFHAPIHSVTWILLLKGNLTTMWKAKQLHVWPIYDSFLNTDGLKFIKPAVVYVVSEVHFIMIQYTILTADDGPRNKNVPCFCNNYYCLLAMRSSISPSNTLTQHSNEPISYTYISDSIHHVYCTLTSKIYNVMYKHLSPSSSGEMGRVGYKGFYQYMPAMCWCTDMYIH